MSSPFPVPVTTPTNATATMEPNVVTVTHVVNRTVPVPVPVEVIPLWIWAVVAGVIMIGIIIGIFVGRWLWLSRLDPVARAFAESRYVAVILGRDGVVEARPLSQVSPMLFISRKYGTIMPVPPGIVTPLKTPGGTTVWFGVKEGQYVIPVPFDEKVVVTAAVLPEGMRSLDSPEAAEALSKAIANLGNFSAVVGPLRIDIAVPAASLVKYLYNYLAGMISAALLSIEAAATTLGKYDKLTQQLLRILSEPFKQQGRWILVLVIVLVVLMLVALFVR